MALDVRGAKKVIRIGDRCQGTGRGLVLSPAEIHIADDGATQPTVIVAEDGLDGRVLEDCAFDQKLCVRARVNARIEKIREEGAIEEMSS